jgi:hypothetical protein
VPRWPPIHAAESLLTLASRACITEDATVTPPFRGTIIGLQNILVLMRVDRSVPTGTPSRG